MPACYSKPVKDGLHHGDDRETKYRFDLSKLSKKEWSVRGVAIEIIDGEDRPVLLFEPSSKNVRTVTTQDFACALRLASENTRPKFEFITIDKSHPFAGRHYNRYSPSWLKGTRFGNILFKGDEEMKVLSHRMRKQDGRYVSSEVRYPGLKGPEQFPYLYAGSSPIYLTCRSVKVSKTNRSCLFMGDPDMRITMDSNPEYSEYVSSLYDVFAHEDAPVLLRVRELAKLVVAAEWLQEKGFKIDEEWLMTNTRSVNPPASKAVIATNEAAHSYTADLAAQLSETLLGDAKVSAKDLPNGAVLDITTAFYDEDSKEGGKKDNKEDSKEDSKEVRISVKASGHDFDWLFEGIPVKTPIAGHVIPAEDTWSDLHAATIAPYWSMEYDGKDEQVSCTRWGGCSMTSMETKPCAQRRAKSAAYESTPIAGGSHLSFENGCIGSLGIPSATGKVCEDDEMNGLPVNKKVQSKGHPKWEGHKTGKKDRKNRRLLGARDLATGAGNVYDEEGDDVVDSKEVYVRRDCSVYENGKKVKELDTEVRTLGLFKPSKKYQKKVPLPPNLVSELKETFECKVCFKTPRSSPVVAASCCGSILGCQDCLKEYYTRKERCISCDQTSGCMKTFRLNGIDEILQELGNGLSGVDSGIIAESLKCTVCHVSPLNSEPSVCRCCGRIVGCSDCINRWHEKKDQCPLCTHENGKANTVSLGAMTSVLQQLQKFLNVAGLLSP